MVTDDGYSRKSRFTAGECLFTGGESLRTGKMIAQFLTAHSSIRHPSPLSVTP